MQTSASMLVLVCTMYSEMVRQSLTALMGGAVTMTLGKGNGKIKYNLHTSVALKEGCHYFQCFDHRSGWH